MEYVTLLPRLTQFTPCTQAGQNPSTATEIIRSTEAGSSRSQHPESMVDDSISDEVEYGIDDDVPYFSDIEAMVLNLDSLLEFILLKKDLKIFLLILLCLLCRY